MMLFWFYLRRTDVLGQTCDMIMAVTCGITQSSKQCWCCYLLLSLL